MLTQSNEIGQLQTQFLLQEREIRRARNNMKDQQDAMQKQIDDIKKNYSILVEQNPDFLIGKRPDWYFEWQRVDTDTGWAVANSDPRRNVMCFGGNISIPNTIDYINRVGEKVTNNFYIPVYMIINRYNNYWSQPVYCIVADRNSKNPFSRRQTTRKTIAKLLYDFFDANNGTDHGDMNVDRLDLSNIHDFYIYRFFEFALGGL